ncbi:hypothetical protein GCM10010307_39790 [Streptomyces vastus]|uniref:RHS repeat protein n=1 Tax=Streptomyces vastus TaxID=285451 RepID=A0ABP6DAQ5_9ACTN
MLLPLGADGSPLTAEFGGIRWIYAFSDEATLARFAIARGEGAREWAYERVLGARLLDAAIPAMPVPCGVALDVGSEGEGALFPPVRGREARAEYNELGLPVRVVNPDGTVMRQTYDDRGNRTSVTAPTGRTTHFTYDEAGRLTAVTDPLGQTTAVRCDRAGLPVEITDPLSRDTSGTRSAGRSRSRGRRARQPAWSGRSRAT